MKRTFLLLLVLSGLYTYTTYEHRITYPAARPLIVLEPPTALISGEPTVRPVQYPNVAPRVCQGPANGKLPPTLADRVRRADQIKIAAGP